MRRKTIFPLQMPAFGNANAPPDSVSYAVYIRDMAAASLHSHESDRKGLETYTGILREKRLYEKLQDEQGRYYKTWTEFCIAAQPYGLGRSADDIAALIREARDPKANAKDPKVLLSNPGPMTEEEAAISYNITNRVKQRGTSAEYYTARIARDRPDILEEMKAGKYKSVRAAAKAAGIIKEETPLDLLKRAWAKASTDEQQDFLRWIAGNGRQKAA
jgi:hypothetical protein